MQNKRRIAEPDNERSLCWTVISKTRNTKLAFSGSAIASTKSSLRMASPSVVYPDSVWVVFVITGRYESPSDAPDLIAKRNFPLIWSFLMHSRRIGRRVVRSKKFTEQTPSVNCIWTVPYISEKNTSQIILSAQKNNILHSVFLRLIRHSWQG